MILRPISGVGLATLTAILASMASVRTAAGQSAPAQSVPEPITLTASSRVKLCPQVDEYPIRDIAWFSKFPTAGAVFVRREAKPDTFTIVALDKAYAVASEAKLELPWSGGLSSIEFCCASPGVLTLLHRDWTGGADSTAYLSLDIATGKELDSGELPGIRVQCAKPLWREGFLLTASVKDAAPVKTVLLRLDLSRREIWRTNAREVAAGEYSPTEIFRTGPDTVGIERNQNDFVDCYSIVDGSRTEVQVEAPGFASELVDSLDNGLAMRVGSFGDETLCLVDRQGKLLRKSQISAPLSTRAPIRSRTALLSNKGSLWLTDGYGIFEIRPDGNARQRGGIEPDANLLQGIAAATVNVKGEVICQDVSTGTLHAFDRAGRLVRSEPTSTVHFPSIRPTDPYLRMDGLANGDVLVSARTGKPYEALFDRDLCVKDARRLTAGLRSLHGPTGNRCEWGAGNRVTVQIQGQDERDVDINVKTGRLLVDVRAIDELTLAAVRYTSSGDFEFICQGMDGGVWHRSSLGDAGSLTSLACGRDWLSVGCFEGKGLLIHSGVRRVFRFDLTDGKTVADTLRYAIDWSVAGAEELVEIDTVTRVVRRFPLPKLAKPAESRPAVK